MKISYEAFRQESTITELFLGAMIEAYNEFYDIDAEQLTGRGQTPGASFL